MIRVKIRDVCNIPGAMKSIHIKLLESIGMYIVFTNIHF